MIHDPMIFLYQQFEIEIKFQLVLIAARFAIDDFIILILTLRIR